MPCCGSPAKLWPDLAQHPAVANKRSRHSKGGQSFSGVSRLDDRSLSAQLQLLRWAITQLADDAQGSGGAGGIGED
jgi:hypothetical protein